MAGDPNIQRAFGNVLKRAREESGLSQERLALEAGIDRTYVSLLERGLRQPTLSTLFLIADRLSTAPHDLVRLVETELEA